MVLARNSTQFALLLVLGYSVFINNLFIDNVNASPGTLRKFVARCFGEVRAVRLFDGFNILYPADLSDELLTECAGNGVFKLYLEVTLPKHADRFLLSDNGILDFCFGHKEDKPKELKAVNVVVSPQFFERLVQVSSRPGRFAEIFRHCSILFLRFFRSCWRSVLRLNLSQSFPSHSKMARFVPVSATQV